MEFDYYYNLKFYRLLYYKLYTNNFTDACIFKFAKYVKAELFLYIIYTFSSIMVYDMYYIIRSYII